MAISQITSSYANPGNGYSPGMYWVAFTNFENIISFSGANGIVSGITLSAGTTFKQYDVNKESSEYSQSQDVSDINGTINYTTNLNVYLAQYSTAVLNRITLLLQQRLVAIVKDRNGNYWCLGFNNSLTGMPSTSTTGKSYSSDPDGLNLVFRALDTIPDYTISASLIPTIVSY